MAPYGSADQGMAEWSNTGDPDDYPPPRLSRALCKAGRVGVLDSKSIRSCLKSWRPIDLTVISPRRARPLNSPNTQHFGRNAGDHE